MMDDSAGAAGGGASAGAGSTMTLTAKKGENLIGAAALRAPQNAAAAGGSAGHGLSASTRALSCGVT